MNIAVIGATGSTGNYFVQNALDNGHHVTVLVRSPEKLTIQHKNLLVVAGSVLNLSDVKRAMKDQDAVFIALGTGKLPKRSRIRRDGTRQVIDAIKALNQDTHIVVLSSLGVGNSGQQIPFYWRLSLGMMLGFAFADHARQESILENSQLPWTILRPTFMSFEEKTGEAVITLPPQKVNIRAEITRDDVSYVALKAIENRQHLNQMLTLTSA